jgi:hypothetical protein
MYLEVKARFEPIAYAKTVVDTDQALEHCFQQAIAALLQAKPPLSYRILVL